MTQRMLVTLLTMAVCSSTAIADTFTVTLKVVDAKQKPVAGAEVGQDWHCTNGIMAVNQNPKFTNAAGKVTVLVDGAAKIKWPLLVLSADRKMGGIAGVSKGDNGTEVTVVLRPTVHVRGKLECKELGIRPECNETRVIPDMFQVPFANCIRGFAWGRSFGPPGEFEFVLPAGKYTFTTGGKDMEGSEQRELLQADHPEQDLGTIDLKPTELARVKGKVMPEWVLADARGAPADVKLRDYRGKWVYIEFWDTM